ncbi:hypothetical protein BCR42DRAFT_487069 [Absidia repens]|uniref:DUF1308 domain-containing protein n=1 Tax=Absidia repens TaxID=90262 RepID=A0A1X2IX33_9FUNG|nr:hypothetical protein BCR42DRAFT_487069 [Absidia repens]
MNSDGEESNTQDLVFAVNKLHERCQYILRDCTTRQDKQPLDGLYRLTQPLNAESLFLEKLLNRPATIKQKYIQSTNLSYLEAVHDAMMLTGPITEVMRAVAVPPKNGQWMALTTMLRRQSLKLDLVAEQERVWIKVIARNTKAFRHEMAGLEWDDGGSDSDSDDDVGGYNDNFSDNDSDSGDGMGGAVTSTSCSFDDLPIFKKARSYLACAQAHPVHYKVPVVVFAFMRIGYNQDPYVQRIMDRLADMGICVYLQNQDSPPLSIRTKYLPAVERVFGDMGQSGLNGNSNALTTSTLNLDVSTVLAMISQLSHHPCGVDDIEGEALQMQATQQATQPILPVLEQILGGKQLVMVQSAFDRLKSIMEVVAGPMEIQRYHYLFPTIRLTASSNDDRNSATAVSLWTTLTPPPAISILPDQPSTRFMQLLDPPLPKQSTASKLNNGRKIRSRFSAFHAGIFGTADHLQLTTISAIQWMPSALAEAGLLGTSIVTHPPRSLAEQKMHIKTG